MKRITHIAAAVMGVVAVFLATPAGKAVLMQYPIIASAIAALTVLGIYRKP